MASPCSTNPQRFLPTTMAECKARGWDTVDVVFVSGDAYLDHPSFAAALLGRVLEAEGFRVAILPQPAWNDASAFREFGRPRLCFAVSAGNMDSMINHYTANKKRRNDDAYSPGGRIGLRPDRATNVYAQRCREAFPGTPVIAGGVEASLRRVAHFDYWSETVRPSILVTSKADLVGFGMGERVLVEICRRLAAGRPITDCRDLRGVAYLLGGKEALPAHEWQDAACDNRDVELPGFEQIKSDKVAFANATRLLHHETNPKNGRRLLQRHGERVLVVNPPALALDEQGMDRIYDLPYTRKPHPRYTEPIPAHVMIKDSVTTMRGCFGGCTFCSITMHQGRAIQSRSEASVVREVEQMAADPSFKGHVSDVGGPTANMYRMRCSRPEIEAKCRRLSCVHPTVCKLLGVDHGPTKRLLEKVRAVPGVKTVRVASGIRMDLARLDDGYLEVMAKHHVGGQLKVAPEIEAKCRRLSCVHPTVCKLLGVDHGPTKRLLEKVREVPGVKTVRVASGIRMDLARLDDGYLEVMARHHVGGQLKVAPEHTSEKVLALMKKPATSTFDEFAEKFAAASARAGKEQYLVPYFIASHPGSGVGEMIELAVFLKQRGYRPRQVQDFIPAPMDIATCMYWTGLDPITMQEVETVKKLKDREVQRALMQYFKPENWFIVHRALLDAGRKDLIGDGPSCLIPANPPKKALQARRDEARGRRGDPTYVHAEDAGVSKRGGLPCAPADDDEDDD